MNKLLVKDFLTVRSAEIELKDIIVLIGAQASGKSVIAKLLYFFKAFINEEIPRSAREESTKTELIKQASARFAEIFPRYSWEGQNFLIEYQVDEVTICVTHGREGNGKPKFAFSYSVNLEKVRKKIASTYKALQLEAEKSRNVRRLASEESMLAEASNKVREGILPTLLEIPTFIPAGRSFFSTLQKNVFSFLAGNIQIDPFLKEFGSAYERAKNLFKHRGDFLRHLSDSTTSLAEIDRLAEGILKGRYRSLKGQDWIESDRCAINVANSSSGQQESLPMLLVLSVLPIFQRGSGSNIFFIEEPEAHLFPDAQQKIIKLIALLFNTFKQNRFFITTHSPYVLSVLNTCIFANEVLKNKKKGQKWDEISKQWAPYAINFDVVAAYNVQSGYARSILNLEERCIDANAIDGVSEEINKEYDELLNIQYGHS